MESTQKQTLTSITSKFYTFAFFDEFILIYPLYTLLFADAGLSPFKIGSLLVVWSLTAFLLEVPSGSIADKYPRKWVLIAGVIIRAIGYSCWLFFPSYWGFLVGFVLWGIKSALTSGTKEALVYDELNKINKLERYTKVMGRMESLGLIAVLLASLGASTLARFGYSPILLLSIASVIVSGIAIFLLPKAQAVRSTLETKYLEYFKEGIKVVFRSSRVLFIVLFMSIVAGLGAVDEYNSLFLRSKGYDNTAVAFGLAIVVLFGIIGSLIAHRLEDKKLPLEGLVLLWGVLLFGATIVPSLVVIIMLGLFTMFFYVVKVLFNTYLQHSIDDKTRATTTSVGGLMAEFFALIIFAMFSIWASSAGYGGVLKMVAVIIGILALLLLVYSHSLRKKKRQTYLP